MRVVHSPTHLRVIPRVLVDARSEATGLIAAARVEADALVEHARGESERIRDEARAAGAFEGRADINAVMAQAVAARAIASDRDLDAVAQLALEVASTILGREAASGPDVLRDVSQRALGRVRRARRIVLHVHPDDFELAQAQCRAWLPAGSDPEIIAAEIDPSVGRGGVIVASEIGRLDARLDTQLEALRRALAGGG